MTALAIAKVSLQRVSRDRTALFFLIALPVFVILIIGATVRGFSTFPVGVVDLGSGRTGQDLVTAMQRSGDFKIHHYSTAASAGKAVARGEISVAVVLPAGMDNSLRAGHTVSVQVLAEQTNSTQQAASSALRSVVAAEGSRIQAAVFATSRQSGTFDDNLSRATALQANVPLVQVATAQVDSRAATLPEGFSYSAPTMLVLFVFINTLVGAANIIETRQLGMYERISAGPVHARSIVAGETAGLFVLALLQAGLIVLVGALAFGVSWGNPLAAVLLIAVWAAVAAGVGILAGTFFRSPQQATVLGPTVGMALGMLGGCMWPLSIVNPLIRSIGHATPHAWAVDAWTALIARGATVAGIATELAALAAFAALLTVLATARLRRQLS